jgi:hypothetical protein
MSEPYIQILNGVVNNIINVDPNTDYLDPSYTWISLAGKKCTDDTNIQIGITTYEDPNFISNITPLTLQQVKTKKLEQSVTEILAFVNSRYDLEKRVNYLGIYNNAINKGLTNRAAYFQPLLDWQNSVYMYSAYVQYTINNLTTIEDVNNFTWDFTTLLNTDPLITYGGAFSINN